jgi:hypothetical protein
MVRLSSLPAGPPAVCQLAAHTLDIAGFPGEGSHSLGSAVAGSRGERKRRGQRVRATQLFEFRPLFDV